MAIHNLTIERNEKIDRLREVSKERDQYKEAALTLALSIVHADYHNLDADVRAALNNVFEIVPRQNESLNMVDYATKVCMGQRG